MLHDSQYQSKSYSLKPPVVSYDEDFGGCEKLEMCDHDRRCAKCGRKVSRYHKVELDNDGTPKPVYCWAHQERVLVYGKDSQQYRAKYRGEMVEADMCLKKMRDYRDKLEIAKEWGFESVSAFIRDFYANVGSSKHLAEALGFNGSRSLMKFLRRTGARTLLGNQNNVANDRRFLAYRMERCGR